MNPWVSAHSGGSVFLQAGTAVNLRGSHEHFLIYWAVLRAFGLDGTEGTKLKVMPGVDAGP